MMEKHYCLWVTKGRYWFSQKKIPSSFYCFLCYTFPHIFVSFSSSASRLLSATTICSWSCGHLLTILHTIPLSFHYKTPSTKCCAIWRESILHSLGAQQTDRRFVLLVRPRWIPYQLREIKIQNLCSFRNKEGCLGTQTFKYHFILSNCVVLHMVLSCSHSKGKQEKNAEVIMKWNFVPRANYTTSH